MDYGDISTCVLRIPRRRSPGDQALTPHPPRSSGAVYKDQAHWTSITLPNPRTRPYRGDFPDVVSPIASSPLAAPVSVHTPRHRPRRLTIVGLFQRPSMRPLPAPPPPLGSSPASTSPGTSARHPATARVEEAFHLKCRELGRRLARPQARRRFAPRFASTSRMCSLRSSTSSTSTARHRGLERPARRRPFLDRSRSASCRLRRLRVALLGDQPPVRRLAGHRLAGQPWLVHGGRPPGAPGRPSQAPMMRLPWRMSRYGRTQPSRSCELDRSRERSARWRTAQPLAVSASSNAGRVSQNDPSTRPPRWPSASTTRASCQ